MARRLRGRWRIGWSEAGYPLIDAPISGGPARAGNGDLLIVVGATEVALAAARPVLDHLSSTLTIVGAKSGDGQALKTINQLLAGVHIAAAAEAIALARGLGLDPAVVIGALAQGAAGSFMFSDRGPRMLQAYTGGAEVKSRVDIFVKDMGIVTGVGRAYHVPLPLAAAAEQLYLIAEAAGLGAKDDSSVVTILSPGLGKDAGSELKRPYAWRAGISPSNSMPWRCAIASTALHADAAVGRQSRRSTREVLHRSARRVYHEGHRIRMRGHIQSRPTAGK